MPTHAIDATTHIGLRTYNVFFENHTQCLAMFGENVAQFYSVSPKTSQLWQAVVSTSVD